MVGVFSTNALCKLCQNPNVEWWRVVRSHRNVAKSNIRTSIEKLPQKYLLSSVLIFPFSGHHSHWSECPYSIALSKQNQPIVSHFYDFHYFQMGQNIENRFCPWADFRVTMEMSCRQQPQQTISSYCAALPWQPIDALASAAQRHRIDANWMAVSSH